ncbi:MAG: hypothetical protein JXB49_18075 [Bacteroidales bacterium]|nr:hypothetical protein [Bacteroidales bacterium]
MKRFKWSKLYVVVIFLITITYFISLVLAPDALGAKLNDVYGSGATSKLTFNNVGFLEDDKIFDMSLEKAFLESRLSLAKADSIGLSINLKDSTIYLVLGGLEIHKARIAGFKSSSFFMQMNRQTFINILSGLMEVESHNGSIVKEPVYYYKAPKDTIEASKRYFSPDTSQIIPAYVQMKLSSHFTLLIMQQETRSLRDFTGRLYFSFKQKAKRTIHDFHNLVMFRLPDYSPQIVIYIPRKDVVNIYRALPDHAQVSMRFVLSNGR